MRRVDVAIVGGGPAGLAAAIEARRRGLSTLVLERQGPTPDKACGEGLMPAGWRALEVLGAASFIPASACGPFAGIRYLQENGTTLQARFREGTGVGVRRLALSSAMQQAATSAGAELRYATPVSNVELDADHVRLTAGDELVEARLLIAADGLQSPLRRQFELDSERGPVRRFGLRRHFRGVTTSGFVDVHWCPDAEAYVTPIGQQRCGVAFLFDSARIEKASFDALLGRFPVLAKQLAGAEPESEVRGAGPLQQRARACVQGRLVLLGDAAGYVDAITGEGLSLAFESARALGTVLPEAIDHPEALDRYALTYEHLFRQYARAATRLVWLAQRPWLRRTAFDTCRLVPGLFERIVHAVAEPLSGST